MRSASSMARSTSVSVTFVAVMVSGHMLLPGVGVSIVLCGSLDWCGL